MLLNHLPFDPGLRCEGCGGCEGCGAAGGGGDRARTVHRIRDGTAGAVGGGVASESAGPGGGADGVGSCVIDFEMGNGMNTRL